MNRPYLAAAAVFLSACSGGCLSAAPSADAVCRGARCVTVEVVQKPEEMQRGLQHRTAMPDDHGMLFVFADNGRHTFWMKDTLIPLDMIWMDYARRIVHIEPNVPPCTADPCPVYGPPTGVQSAYVLEINAGQGRVWGINVGDTLEFRLKDF